MRYIFLNLASFFAKGKLLLLIVFICVISSAFIINFSYGLYYNYHMQNKEEDVDFKAPDIFIAEGKVLTKGDVKRYVEALDSSVHRDVDVIFAAVDIAEYGFGQNSLDFLPLRFRFLDGKYQISEITRDNWISIEAILSGRYITNEEEAQGKQVALITVNEDGTWLKSFENLRSGENSINIFNKEYDVVGFLNHASGSVPIVPFLTVPDDKRVTDFGIIFGKDMTHRQYDELKNTAARVIPGILVFPEIIFPDMDAIAIYQNMTVIALVISVLSVLNFAMIYHFVLKKRGRTLAVMRICGCSKIKAVLIYLGECVMITLPAYLIGTLINVYCINNVFGRVFEFITEAYSFKIYGIIAAVFFSVFLIILSVMIFNSVNKTVAEGRKE